MEGVWPSGAFAATMPGVGSEGSANAGCLNGLVPAEQPAYGWWPNQQQQQYASQGTCELNAVGSGLAFVDGCTSCEDEIAFVPAVGDEESKEVSGVVAEEEAEEEVVSSYPALHICPAAMNAARESTRHLLHRLLNGRHMAPTPPLSTSRRTAPLAITWHASPSQPSSLSLPFVPLPHTKRTREVSELLDVGPSEKAGDLAVGVLDGASRSLPCSAPKCWRVEKQDRPAAHNGTKWTSGVRQGLLSMEERKRCREEETPIDGDAPHLLTRPRRF